MNTLNSPFLLTDNQSRDVQNVQGTTAGAIVKRGGQVTLATMGNTPYSLFMLESTSPAYLIASASTGLYSISSAGTVTSIGGPFTPGGLWSFVSAPIVSGQGPLYGMNGTDTPQQWVGTGTTGPWTNATGAVAVPNGKYCVYHQNQVYVAGVAANPSRLYWSAIADPTNWDPTSLTGAGFMDFDPNDGQAITGIGTVGPYLLICKARKLWVFIDPAGPTTRKLSETVGCVSHRSIAEGAEGTYFLSEDRGVFVTNGSKLTPISDHIQPTIDGIDNGTRPYAAGVYFKSHYYLSATALNLFPVTGMVLDFDAKLNSWWVHTLDINQFAVGHFTSPPGPTLYGARGNSGSLTVDECFMPGVYQDNGTNFTWVWRGPWQSPTFYRRRRFPTPYFRKRMRQIRFDGSGTVDFSLAKDFGNEALIRSDIFSNSAIPGRAKVYGGIGVANVFSAVFSGTSNNPGILYEYVLMLTDRRDLVAS